MRLNNFLCLLMLTLVGCSAAEPVTHDLNGHVVKQITFPGEWSHMAFVADESSVGTSAYLDGRINRERHTFQGEQGQRVFVTGVQIERENFFPKFTESPDFKTHAFAHGPWRCLQVHEMNSDIYTGSYQGLFYAWLDVAEWGHVLVKFTCMFAEENATLFDESDVNNILDGIVVEAP